MKVLLRHPTNETMVRFLKNPYDFMTGPKAGVFREARRRDLADYRVRDSQAPDSIDWFELGTHPDVIERFWNKITILLPEPCQWVVYGAPVLVHPLTGVIFGWAGGSSSYGLRLPDGLRQEALKAGAKRTQDYSSGDTLDLAQLGPEWVLGNWLQDEARWCLKAFEHAA